MDWDAEVLRLARLARLEVADPAGLARACEAITRDFSDLALYAESLPASPEQGTGPLREDEPRPASAEEVAAILAAVPRLDPATGAVVAPRGRG